MAFLRRNWFNVTLAAFFALALARPSLGAKDSPLQPDLLRTACVAAIFFLTGLQLRTAELRAGLASYRLHVFTQGFGYAVVPALAVGLRALHPPFLPPEILTGIVVLAILPTTITSCVVFTTLAHGNVAGAVFNSVAGNMAGVVVSPLLFAWLVADSVGVRIDWSQLVKIAELIVLPLALGFALRNPLRPAVERARAYLPFVSGGALLAIVFFAFTSAFAPESALWRWSPAQLAAPILVVAVMHAVLLAGAWYGARACGLAESDLRAAMFLAPQKTVAMGLPLLHLFFSGQPELAGLVSIPLIFYHPLQLLVAGPLAARLAARPAKR